MFRKSKKNLSGLEGACKLCRAKRNLELRHIKYPLKGKNPVPLIERRRIYAKEKYHAHKELFNKKNAEYYKKRKITDPIFKLKLTLRVRISVAVKRALIGKKSKGTATLLGQDFETVKKYLERKFKKGMTWENHGKGSDKWHIDHIIPLSSAKTEEDLYRLCHYTNLQPMWATDNIRKYNKIPNVQVTMNI